MTTTHDARLRVVEQLSEEIVRAYLRAAIRFQRIAGTSGINVYDHDLRLIAKVLLMISERITTEIEHPSPKGYVLASLDTMESERVLLDTEERGS